jgi:adenylylsulfate kinase
MFLGDCLLGGSGAIMKSYSQTKRSLVKATTFRAVILCSDTIVIFLITHRWETTGALVIITNIASTTLYFLHERVWSRIQWGRATVPDPPTAVSD